MSDPACDLCRTDGGRPMSRDESWRVVGVDDPEFPAYYRDLQSARARVHDALPALDAALRQALV